MASTVGRIARVPKELVGASGRRYRFKELLQDKPQLGSIWVASDGDGQFVLKDVPKHIYSNFRDRIWPQLRPNASPLWRLPIDTTPGRGTFVYEYMTDDFHRLVKIDLSLHARRQILKLSLQAIAQLHDRDVVHLDVKPDNILVNVKHAEAVMSVEQVRLSDIENAAHLPSGRCIKGMLAGNENWRSIEGHFKGELSKPSDVFSFGLVCLYAILRRVVCGVDEDFHKHESQGAMPEAIRLQRLVSYFGDQAGIDGLMKHVGDDDANREILATLWEERHQDYIPYKPFAEWPEAEAGRDATFSDLIHGLTNLDPRRRLTASEALAHPWFADEARPEVSS